MRTLFISLILLTTQHSASAQSEVFNTGPVFTDFGAHAAVQQTTPVSAGSSFKIAYDVAKKAAADQRNRHMESAARFINMHVAAGVEFDHIELAVVVHGQAVKDLIKPTEGAEMTAQMKMVTEMLDHGVRFYVCGQSAAYYQVKNEDLIPGVKMSLSAMTVHAQLQQQGYTLNPF